MPNKYEVHFFGATVSDVGPVSAVILERPADNPPEADCARHFEINDLIAILKPER